MAKKLQLEELGQSAHNVSLPVPTRTTSITFHPRSSTVNQPSINRLPIAHQPSIHRPSPFGTDWSRLVLF